MYIWCFARHPSVKCYLWLCVIEIRVTRTVFGCMRHSHLSQESNYSGFHGMKTTGEEGRCLMEALGGSSMVLQRSAITHHQSHSHGGQSCHQIGITDRQSDRLTTSQPGGNSWQELQVWRMDGWTEVRPHHAGGTAQRSQMSLRVITTSASLYGMI